MTVQCIDCEQWRPRETDKEMVKLGFAVCKVCSIGPGNTFSGTYERDCDRFQRAEQDVIDKRRNYEGKT